MLRRFSLALITLFVLTQQFALLHMAAYGFAEHKHHGQNCEVYFFSEKTKHSDTPALPVSASAETVLFAVPALTPPLRHGADRYPPASPRAPPAALLS